MKPVFIQHSRIAVVIVTMLYGTHISNLYAQQNESIELGGFLDTYIAHEEQPPVTRTRSYTTQALYADEANLNLGYLDAKLDASEWRGRVAAQYGSSVINNYAAEPDSFWRYVQEANIGYQLFPNIWLSGGIFLAHIGPESWISRDNITYTRSLISEYSPYYQSGLMLSSVLSDTVSAQIHLLRGWQNISDDRDLALGTQLSYQVSPSLNFVHNTFIGDENGTRILNDFILKANLSSSVQLIAAYDLGYQDQENRSVWWHGSSLMTQYKYSDDLAFSARFEHFYDPHSVVVAPVVGSRFMVTGLSFNVDYQLMSKLWWRNEYKTLIGTQSVFEHTTNSSQSVQTMISSISYTF